MPLANMKPHSVLEKLCENVEEFCASVPKQKRCDWMDLDNVTTAR